MENRKEYICLKCGYVLTKPPKKVPRFCSNCRSKFWHDASTIQKGAIRRPSFTLQTGRKAKGKKRTK